MCGLCGEQVDYYIRALGKGEFMFFFFDLLFSFSSFLICLRLTVFLCQFQHGTCRTSAAQPVTNPLERRLTLRREANPTVWRITRHCFCPSARNGEFVFVLFCFIIRPKKICIQVFHLCVYSGDSIDGVVITFKELSYHPDCHSCPLCQKRIEGPCVFTMGSPYHSDCFNCGVCRKRFGKDSPYFLIEVSCQNGWSCCFCWLCFFCFFFVFVFVVESFFFFFFLFLNSTQQAKPYCEFHFHEKRGTICYECKQPITTGAVCRVEDKAYHLQHFKCVLCQAMIGDGEDCFSRNGFPMCADCNNNGQWDPSRFQFQMCSSRKERKRNKKKREENEKKKKKKGFAGLFFADTKTMPLDVWDLYGSLTVAAPFIPVRVLPERRRKKVRNSYEPKKQLKVRTIFLHSTGHHSHTVHLVFLSITLEGSIR